jgi:hypothetical protein
MSDIYDGLAKPSLLRVQRTGNCMRLKRFVGLILITVYLFSGNGLAAACNLLDDARLSIFQYSCTDESLITPADSPAPAIAETEDILEQGCDFGYHVPSGASLPARNFDLVSFLPPEVPHPQLQVYIPIFVPPRNLA